VTALTVVVAMLATYSLTLLVVCDKITDRPRQWVLTRISGHGYAGPRGASGIYGCACETWSESLDDLLDHVHDARQQLVDEIPMSKRAALMYLLRCPWCASCWIAAPVAWSAWCFGDRAWWFVPALALGMRAATGALAQYANPRA
jgi:hypothetical protein